MAKNILLVEDDPFLIEIYQKKLSSVGFNVEVIQNGKKALEWLGQNKPDLILLDIVLPEADGWKVMRQLKEQDKLKDLIIVVLSNLGQKEEVEKGLKMGAVKYLIKAQFTPAEVVEEVKKILK